MKRVLKPIIRRMMCATIFTLSLPLLASGQQQERVVDWDALNRLHESGLIRDPKNKNKSVGLSQEGARRSEELFWKFFGKQS